MNQLNTKYHVKTQYFLIVAGLALVAMLPRAEAQNNNSALAGRIAQLESRTAALANRVQALENLTSVFRRNGNQLTLNAHNLNIRDLTVSGNLAVRGNSTLGDGGEDTLTVSSTAAIGGPVSTLGDVSVSGELDVSGDVRARSNARVDGNYQMYGNGHLGGNVTVFGVFTAESNTFLGGNDSTFVSVTGGLVVQHSMQVGASANSSDFFRVHTPLVEFVNMDTVHFNFGGTGGPLTGYTGGLVVTDGNVFVRNTDGTASTNGRGNLIIGDGQVGNGSTWRNGNVGSLTNSLILGYNHWLPNVDVTGAIVSGHGHDVGGSWSAMLGGHENIIGSTYGFTLGGNNNYAQRSGTGHVGGYGNAILGGAFDQWHVGVGDTKFNPN